MCKCVERPKLVAMWVMHIVFFSGIDLKSVYSQRLTLSTLPATSSSLANSATTKLSGKKKRQNYYSTTHAQHNHT